MRKFYLAALISLLPLPAYAEDGCTLIISYPDAKVLHESGNCDQRRSPASTFKIPLALMGFDTGILTDMHTPRWQPTTGPSDEPEVDPAIWLKDSLVWFSRRITQELGATKFQNYVRLFHYGNLDVSGTPGLNDGLGNSWLFSSLKISPREQVRFIQALLNRGLTVSDTAYDMTIASMPRFTAGDWQVIGKTGSGWLRDASGEYNKNRPQGWFVGWAQLGSRQVIFARLTLSYGAREEYAGPLARDTLLRELPNLMAQSNDVR